MTVTNSPNTVPPGWYPNTSHPGSERWWDGVRWTEHVQPMFFAQPVAPTAPPMQMPTMTFPRAAPPAGAAPTQPSTATQAPAPLLAPTQPTPTVLSPGDASLVVDAGHSPSDRHRSFKIIVAIASVIVIGSTIYAATHRSPTAERPKIVVIDADTPAAGAATSIGAATSGNPAKAAKPGKPAPTPADPQGPPGPSNSETPVDSDAATTPGEAPGAPSPKGERLRLLSEQTHLSGIITNGDGSGTSDIDLWYGPNGTRREDRVVEGATASITSSIVKVNNVNYWNTTTIAGLGDRWVITPSNSAPSRADWFTETLAGWEALSPTLLGDDETDGFRTRHYAIVPRVSAGAAAETAEIWVDDVDMPRRIVVRTIDLSGTASTIDVIASYDEEISIEAPTKTITNEELEAAKKAKAGG